MIVGESTAQDRCRRTSSSDGASALCLNPDSQPRLLADAPSTRHAPPLTLTRHHAHRHGESLNGRQVGRPLFLDRQRVEALRRLWGEHRIAQTVTTMRSAATRVILTNYY